MAQYNLNKNYQLKSVVEGELYTCYWNSYSKFNTLTLSNGNLTIEKSSSDGNWDWARGTRGVSSGRWYWEVKVNVASPTRLMIGITTIDNPSGSYIASDYGWAYEGYYGGLWHSGTGQQHWGDAYVAGDTIGIALDLDDSKLFFTDGSGNWQNSQNPVLGINAAFTNILFNTKIYPAIGFIYINQKVTANFGATNFLYTIPEGYNPLYYNDISSEGGNRSLSWLDIDLLSDGDTSEKGVSLTSSDILHMETDLTDRIKIDSIKLYIDSPSASGTVLDHINFYYRDDPEDPYTIIDKAIAIGGYYYGTIPYPSAPSKIYTTISGIEATIYEYGIYNDEYLVNYGNEGQLSRKYLDRATIGQTGTPTTLAIFNNNIDLNDPAIDAYVCVDYSGQPGDYYIKLSDSEGGDYVGLSDGNYVEDDAVTSSLRWSHGIFTNTEVSGTSVVLSNTSASYDINTIPLADSDAYGWRCAMNCWEWDSINKRILCMGSDDGPQLKLWSYDITNNEFSFMTRININGPTDHYMNATMTYMNKKVYVCMNNDGKFGYYDTTGIVNNWTSLADIPEILTDNTNDKIGIVGDGERYIYALCGDADSSTVPGTYSTFHRYDTISGTTWTTLDNNFKTVYSSTSWGLGLRLAYDGDHNCIYLVSGHSAQSADDTPLWIQRYDIATNTWNRTYFRLGDYFNTVQVWRCGISYVDNKIYVYLNALAVNSLYYVDLDTFTVKTKVSNFAYFNSSYGIGYIIAIDDEEGHVFVANVNGDSKALYGTSSYVNSGSYISPVFAVDDKYKVSYFVVDYTCNGNQNISWDDDYRNGTVYIKSSDIKPIDLKEFYFPYRNGDNMLIKKLDLYTDITSNGFISLANTYGRWHWSAIAISDDGTLALSRYYYYSGALQSQLFFYNRSGAQTYSLSDTTDNTYNYTLIKFDSLGGVWAHTPYVTNGKLCHYSSSLVKTCDIVAGGTGFMDLAPSKGYSDCWYITSGNVVLVNYYGSTIKSYTLSDGQKVCPTEDGGCWAVLSDDVVYRYTRSNFVTSVGTSVPVEYIDKDYESGFWYSDSFRVYHCNSDGVELFSVDVGSITGLQGGRNYCLVYDSADKVVKLVSGITRAIEKTYDVSAWTETDITPAFFTYSLDDFYENNAIEIPLDYDPVWKASTIYSAPWVEGQLNGEWLEKVRYHQLYLKLRTKVPNTSPAIHAIALAPAVQITGIPSQSYKNLYIKTSVPIGANVANYETKLRTWWAVTDI